MHYVVALANVGSDGAKSLSMSHSLPIWEPVRFGVRVVGATMTACAARKRPGFERAAEDPLGARE